MDRLRAQGEGGAGGRDGRSGRGGGRSGSGRESGGGGGPSDQGRGDGRGESGRPRRRGGRSRGRRRRRGRGSKAPAEQRQQGKPAQVKQAPGRGPGRQPGTARSAGPASPSPAVGERPARGEPGRRPSRKRRSRNRRRAARRFARATAAEPQKAVAPEVVPGELRYTLPEWHPDADGDEVSALLVEAADEADEDEEELEELAPEGQLVNLVPVRIASPSQVEQYQAGEIVLDKGDLVVVETERGQVVGHVVAPSVRQVVLDGPARKVIRRMDRNDLRQQIRNQRKAREAYTFGRERAAARNLKMKLVRVDYLHGGNKAVFYFTADGRIDFRELIKDLARRFRIRVEMRQIGVRDEAGLTGGVGTCGLQLCCNTFLRRFEQISIRMAKDQALVLNPQKISGQCGRLKCCLVYEHELYQAMRKGLPKVGKRIETPKGQGKVLDLDILKRRIKVGLDEGPVESFTATELGLDESSKKEGTSKPTDPKDQG